MENTSMTMVRGKEALGGRGVGGSEQREAENGGGGERERGVSWKTREGREGFQKEAFEGGLGTAQPRQVYPLSSAVPGALWGPLLEPFGEALWCRPVHQGLQHLPGPSRY